MQPKPPKPKRCKRCLVKFQPTRSIQPCCRFECELAYANEHAKKKANNRELQAKKAERAATKANSKRKREFLDNDRSHQIKLTQAAVNKWVRFRDEGCSCISCGKDINGGGYIGSGSKQAGHYRSAGGCPELRFNTLNINIQCQRCNVQLSGNIGEYRPRLIDKIGLELVEWLEGPHEPKKYTCEQLRAIRSYYAKLNREGVRVDDDRPY